jgi:hypothetical protein
VVWDQRRTAVVDHRSDQDNGVVTVGRTGVIW